MSFSVEPLVPFPVWMTLAVCIVVVLVVYLNSQKMVGVRRWPIIALMTVSFLVPLLILLNPTLTHTIPPPAGKPILDIAIDHSISMGTKDVAEESRLNAALAVAKSLESELSDQFEIRFKRFGGELAVLDTAEPTSATDSLYKQTDLGIAVQDSLNEVAPQGQAVLVMSDGIHNQGLVGDLFRTAERANAMSVPIYTMTLGGKVGVKNISLQLPAPQELAFVEQSVPVAISLRTDNLPMGEFNVSLWKEGEQVEENSVRVAEGQSVSVAPFEISESQPGLYRYRVQVEHVVGEATIADNHATLLLRVVDSPVKVLLLEGKPYWDTKFLIRKLATDPSIQLTSLVQLANDRFLERTVIRSKNDDGKFDSSESSHIHSDVRQFLTLEQLRDVQIVILGRESEVFLDDDVLDAFRDWISRDGGSLVCARGAPSAQLTERLTGIMPVDWSASRERRFRMQLTDSGKALSWLSGIGSDASFLSTMPTLASTSTPAARSGLSNVLVESEIQSEVESPVISFQQYGLGRTIVVEGAGMWRWALMSPEYQDREKVYQTLWRNLLNWLASRAGLLPGQNISLQADRVNFEIGETATATLLVRTEAVDELPMVVLRSADNESEAKQFSPIADGQDPGLFRVEFSDLEVGSYSAEAKIAGDDSSLSTTVFDVRESFTENLELDARPDLMKRISNLSGGEAIEPGQHAEVGTRMQEHLKNLYPKQLRREQVWDRWWVWLIGIACWIATWSVRRNSGLI